MSGIVGTLHTDGRPVDGRLLRRMTEFLAFRGPDAQDVWTDGHVGFGHALLRTTFESEREAQPCNLDGQVWITADARIDGRDDLIRKLADREVESLRQAPDVELILHAYHRWGEDCLQHLLGDFAFALWDGRHRRLFCARDHLGVKPFYYARVENCLVFSNTLNCLRMHPEVSDKLNDLAIADFLLFEFNQDPATTPFADIHILPPAHYLSWQQGRLDISRYWSLPMPPTLRYQRDQDYVEHFRELLQQAVADRLRSSCIGVSMSGGLDSPSVAAFAVELRNRRSVTFDLRAYTIVYDSLIPDEERHYSGLVAAHLNIPIHYHVADGYQLYERWDQAELHRPIPQHYPLMASWVDWIKMIVRRSRVVLTGEGGDIIFSPSGSYFDDLLKSMQWGRLTKEIAQSLKYRRLPRFGLRSRLLPWRYRAKGFDFPGWLDQSFSDGLGLKARWARFKNPLLPSYPVRKRVYQALTNPAWPDDWQKLYDPGVTGLPVEFCHPYLDLRVVNFTLALPEWPWCLDKLLSREIGRGLLPEAVRTRPKAALAGEPVSELVRHPESSWINGFVPTRGLRRYVNLAAIPLFTYERDHHKIWANLRPLTLHFWLKHL